ncbi:MAG TPA: copper-binding protein [Bryobacteraceae bacterium]|jgi:protein SCO1/2|nr:copper-binding protein [Bryobacteraceae bacterium]
MRYLAAAIFLLILGCAREAPVHRYALRGEIVKVDPSAHTVTIRHERIDGWMEAMTMEFPVKDAKEFAALRAGERVTATVFVSDAGAYWIGDIRQE